MSHTPGPWKACKDTYGVLRVWGFVDADGEREEVDVASCCGDGSLDYDEELANAAFIATAPDIEAERDELRKRVGEVEVELHAAIEQRSLVLERRDEAIAEAVMRERKACADIVEDASIAADFRASHWAGFGADVRARERIMLAIELRESAAAIRARSRT